MSWGIFHGKLAPNEFASTKCGPKHGFSGFSWEGSQESDSIRSESPWNSHNLVWKNLVASYPNGWSWVSSCSRVLSRKENVGKIARVVRPELDSWFPLEIGIVVSFLVRAVYVIHSGLNVSFLQCFFCKCAESSISSMGPWEIGLPCDVRVPNEASNLFSSWKYTCRALLHG